MISTRLYELVHRFRSQGQLNEALPLSLSDFTQLRRELMEMHCVRALRALSEPTPRYCGLTLSVESD